MMVATEPDQYFSNCYFVGVNVLYDVIESTVVSVKFRNTA